MLVVGGWGEGGLWGAVQAYLISVVSSGLAVGVDLVAAVVGDCKVGGEELTLSISRQPNTKYLI